MDAVRMQACVIGPAGQGQLRLSLRGPGDRHREVSVPAERIPAELRMPNREFVAVMHAEHFIGVEPAAQAWMEVQRQIRSILNTEWDPIRVADSVEDEYDIYIARLYAMLQRDDSSENIAQHPVDRTGKMEQEVALTGGRTTTGSSASETPSIVRPEHEGRSCTSFCVTWRRSNSMALPGFLESILPIETSFPI